MRSPGIVECGNFPADWWRVEQHDVDLIVTDPPYNINYTYAGYNDNKTPAEYADWTLDWTRKAVDILSPTGSLAVVIGDNFAAELKLILDRAGMTMRNWIVWSYTFGQHCLKKFGRDHAHILYYVKDAKRFTFNADAVKIESERQRIGDKRAAVGGRVPGDVWSFPRLVGNAKERLDHPCQLPEALVERLILSLSNAGDTVFDPFAGSGTVPAVAVKNGRRAVAMDISPVYCELIERRLQAIHTDTRSHECPQSLTATMLPTGLGGTASG